MAKGFVDIQNNGWMGTDFTAPGLTVERVKEITRDLVARGTIAYCPTVITGNPDDYKKNFNVISQAMQDPETGPHILGIHLEGPFISPESGALGAHPKEHVLKPDIKTFDRFQEWAAGNIKILTVAPEMPGSADLIGHAVENGVTVSMGHHLASDEDMECAVAAGASLCTHVGNGMPNEINRHQNPLWWQMACDMVSGLFVTDGHHLPADLITVALRSKTTDRFIVTSDASPLAGMPPGEYTILGGLPVVLDDTGLIYSTQSQSLAGSHSTMMECMNYLASLNIVNESELWKVGLENPLRAIGKHLDAVEGLNGPEVFFSDNTFVLKG